MKNNWLGVLLLGLGAFCSSMAFSLGLGGITTESVLNEPLIAEIELINIGDLENTQILVDIGAESDYELAGVTREFFHNELEFEVHAEGVGQPRIIVRTQGPLQDPYLNFMVQVRWPQGKLLREYTLLLDMPVFSRQDAAQGASQQSENSAPTTAREAVAQQQSRQQQTSRQQTTTNRVTTYAQPRSNAATGRNYQVASGDTLWGLAGDVSRNTGLSRHQAMLAIHDQNRDAFVNGDINRLRANAVLSIPSEAQMSERSQGQAFRDFSSLAQQATATPVQSNSNNFRNNSGDQAAGQAGRLALSSNQETGNAGAINAAEAAAAEDQSAASAALSNTLAENTTLKEQLDASEIEKQELQDRVANLEEQIQLIQEQAALEIESEELAAVQAAATAEVPESEETVEPELPVAATEPPAAASEPESLLDKVMAFRYWIFGGLALILVIALLIVLLVMRRKKSSEVEELYYEDDEYEGEVEDEPAGEEDLLSDEDYEDEFEDEYDEDEELDEGIDEITKELDPEDDENSESEEALDEEDEPFVATSFAAADEEDGFESGEFEDLDEFFGDESADATNVLFGAEDADDREGSESSEDSTEASEPEVVAEEESELEDGQDSALEFSAEDLDVDAEEEEELFEHDDDDGLEFEIGELAPSEDDATHGADDEIDLENKFDFAEPGVTDDLAPEAAEEFEESIEVHSSDMEELLVPSDDDAESEEDELFEDDAPESSIEGFEAELDEDFVEDLGEEEPLLEGDEEDKSSGSILDLDEDLNLDEDMDADLGDLDLDGGDLDGEDADEEFLTKLELAEAYIEMGDVQGARELLSEVEKDGNAEQKAAAKSLLENVKD